jgi:hypothetical protein
MHNGKGTDQREIVERVRRIETRVTKIGQAMGVDVGGGKPVWFDGKIGAPSPNCSIGDLLRTIPAGHDKDVDVYVHDDYLFTMYVDR